MVHCPWGYLYIEHESYSLVSFISGSVISSGWCCVLIRDQLLSLVLHHVIYQHKAIKLPFLFFAHFSFFHPTCSYQFPLINRCFYFSILFFFSHSLSFCLGMTAEQRERAEMSACLHHLCYCCAALKIWKLLSMLSDIYGHWERV